MKGKVVVTSHAVARARERWPEFPGDRDALSRWIIRDVVAAVEAGRMAVNLPRFAVRRGCSTRANATWQGPRRRKPATRYVWTEDERRVYVICRGDKTVVLTAIRPDSAESEAA